MNQSMMAKTIRYLSIFSKQDNVAGLQLADFIAYNTTAVKSFFKDNNMTEFQNKIAERLYNGNKYLLTILMGTHILFIDTEMIT